MLCEMLNREMRDLERENKLCRTNCKDLAILVISYDGAEELWKPFSQAWNQKWSDCPFEIILITQNVSNLEESCFDKVFSVPSEASRAIYRIKEALKKIRSKYVLIMCDDYFLYESPDVCALMDIIDTMKKKYISCVHLENSVEYAGKLSVTEIKNNSFLVSGGVPSIYKKDFMYMLCEKFSECTMREWELKASRWLNGEQYIIKNINNSTFICYHCVLEGYWRMNPYLWAKRNNLDVSFGVYKKPEILHSLKAVGKAVCFNIVLKFFPKLYDTWAQKKYK